MLSRVARGAALVVACAGLVASARGVAWADDLGPVGGGGSVTCDKVTNICSATAGTTGSSSSPAPTAGSGGGSGGSSGSSGGGAVPSPEPTLINGSCTYAADPTYTPPAWLGPDPHAGQAGAWYQMTCPDAIKAGTNIATTTTSEVWLATPPPAAVMLPAATVLAQRASQSFKLPSPVLAGSPKLANAGLVGVPSWFWTGRAMWSPVSATASVPGESVTATATPVSMFFDFGDGTTGTCAGPGTPYNTSDDPMSASPDCGHTYRKSSGTAPGGVYTVTARVVWRVTWSGAGQLGALNGMTTTQSVLLRVDQSQAIVTR